jgi:hypothetical protein
MWPSLYHFVACFHGRLPTHPIHLSVISAVYTSSALYGRLVRILNFVNITGKAMACRDKSGDR